MTNAAPESRLKKPNLLTKIFSNNSQGVFTIRGVSPSMYPRAEGTM